MATLPPFEKGVRGWHISVALSLNPPRGFECREIRTLAIENEILKRAAAYFARENVLSLPCLGR